MIPKKQKILIRAFDFIVEFCVNLLSLTMLSNERVPFLQDIIYCQSIGARSISVNRIQNKQLK